ncbi:hypothetical protein AKO1_002445, partial [Acrasis kona]
MSADENFKIVNKARYTLNYTVRFMDRKWKVVFIPTDKYRGNITYPDFNPFIPLLVSCIVWLLSMVFCIFLSSLRTSLRNLRDQRKQENRSMVMRKFFQTNLT